MATQNPTNQTNLTTCAATSQTSLTPTVMMAVAAAAAATTSSTQAIMNANNVMQPLLGHDIELESIQASDFESDTIRDSDKNLNVVAQDDRFSSISRYMVTSTTHRVAPIVHMHSICSMSDTASSSVQNSATNVRALIAPPYQTSQQQYISGTTSNSDVEVNCSMATPSKLAPSLLALQQQQQQTPVNLSSRKSVTTTESDSSVRLATFFDVSVMRCLMSSKWHASGYLWSLEYLACRVAEITDYILREQDAYYRVNSSSLPTNLNQLFVMMGCDSYDLEQQQQDGKAYLGSGPADLIELIDQIYLESDFFSKKRAAATTTRQQSTLCSMYDYVKRRKYEATFQARIRYAYLSTSRLYLSII